MKNQVESATEKGSISEEIRSQHRGFLEWNDKVSKQNHQPIVQVNNNIVLMWWNLLEQILYVIIIIILCVVNF